MPFFIPLLPRIIRDFRILAQSPPIHVPYILAEFFPFPVIIPRHLFFLLINVATQYLCVRGVNRLSAISTALTITIILNLRKFTSLALSVIIFGNTLATGVKIGAVLVGTGAAWYAFESRGRGINRYALPIASRDRSNDRRANGGLLSKSWGENTEMNLLKPLGEGETIKLPKTPVFSVSEMNGGSGGGIVGTPLSELVDKKDLGLHSSTVAGGGKPRRRSITD
jgi:hypothetical protein